MRLAIGWLPLAHTAALAGYLLARPALVLLEPLAPAGRLWSRASDLLALVSEFTPLLFLPLPLWLATAAIARTRQALLAAAAPWLIFAWLYGELFLPRPAHLATSFATFTGAPLDGVPVRVMTFNLLAQSRPAGGILAVIAQADPDVILVQELGASLAGAMHEALGVSYPYSRLRTGGWGGTGIWSRFPIEAEEQWPGSERGAQWQHAVLDVAGRRLHVVNLHLSTPTTRWRPRADGPLSLPALPTGETTTGRTTEIATLVPRLRALAQGPQGLVVAGDLNLTDQTPEYRALRSAGLADAYRSAGWGFGHTFPVGRRARLGPWRVTIPVPLLRLDYILYSPHLAVTRARVWPSSRGSDHLPVVADLLLPQG
jgi:vancomycin resistance protein VanJ